MVEQPQTLPSKCRLFKEIQLPLPGELTQEYRVLSGEDCGRPESPGASGVIGESCSEESLD